MTDPVIRRAVAADLPTITRIYDHAVRTGTAEEADKVRRAGSHLWIMGPGGTSFGTPMKPRPVISLWPTLIPRSFVDQKTEILVS